VLPLAFSLCSGWRDCSTLGPCLNTLDVRSLGLHDCCTQDACRCGAQRVCTDAASLCVCIAPGAARRTNDVRGTGVRPGLPELNLCSNVTAELATVANAGSTDIPAGFECLTTIGTLDMWISCKLYYFCGNVPAHASNADGETLDAPSYRLVRECTRLLSNQVIGTAGLAHCGKGTSKRYS
jgi:hypothetical protein